MRKTAGWSDRLQQNLIQALIKSYQIVWWQLHQILVVSLVRGTSKQGQLRRLVVSAISMSARLEFTFAIAAMSRTPRTDFYAMH